MTQLSDLIALIDATIYTNGNNEIEAVNHNSMLDSLVTDLWSRATSDTYANLEIERVNNRLRVGHAYIVSDYETIYDQHETGDVKTGSVEPLLIIAVKNNKFGTLAFSQTHPNDSIRYEFEINQTDATTPIKGRIFERIDEYENRTDYDHRTVLFPRWETSAGSGVFTVLSDNGETMQEYLTFGSSYPTSAISNNNLGKTYKARGELGQEFSNLVFQGGFVLGVNVSGILMNSTFLDEVFLMNISSFSFGNTFAGAISNLSATGNIQEGVFNGDVTNLNVNARILQSTFDDTIDNVTIMSSVTGVTFNGALDTCLFSSVTLSSTFGSIDSSIIGYINNSTIGNITGSEIKAIEDSTIGTVDKCDINVIFNTTTGNLEDFFLKASLEDSAIDNLINVTFLTDVLTVTISDELEDCIVSGRPISGKTMSAALYANLFPVGSEYKKEIFYGSDNKVYFSYFDGAAVQYTEIV